MTRNRLVPIVAGVVCGLLVGGVIAIVRVGGGLGDGPACRVEAGSRQVRLTPDQARAASGLAARMIREGERARAVSVALTGHEATGGLAAADARAVASALTGNYQDGAFSCTARSSTDRASPRLDGRGLTGRAERVRLDLRRTFGALRMGGYAPGGVHTGHMAGSAHYEGRAIDIFFRPIGPEHRRQGWALAYYLVARAEALHIEHVIFDDMIWSAGPQSKRGFRAYRAQGLAGRPARTVAILQHRDHVHVDVSR